MPTVNELVTQVRDILDEASAFGGTGGQWSDSQLKRWLNEGNRDLARATGRYKADSSAISMVSGTAEYPCATNVITVQFAYYLPNDGSNRRIPLEPMQWESMDGKWGSYQAQTGAYPRWFSWWGFQPNLLLRLFPVPSSNTATVVLKVTRLPVEITISNASDTSTVDTDPVWYDALVDYCEYKALRKDRDPRWQEAYQMFEEKRIELVNNIDQGTANREVRPANAGWDDGGYGGYGGGYGIDDWGVW